MLDRGERPALVLDPGRDALGRVREELDVLALDVDVAARVADPEREPERRVAERAAERVLDLLRLGRLGHLEQQPADLGAREPRPQQAVEERERDGEQGREQQPVERARRAGRRRARRRG